MSFARVLAAIGRVMITAGVLILLFVVYQLWGTGIRERQAQDRLEKRFNERLVGGGDDGTIGGADTSSTTPTSTTVAGGGSTTVATLPAVTAPADVAPIAEGDPVGKIAIPKIGLSAYVIEGVALDDLKEGPGHYPDTPYPGQKGNAGIAGHRTTYGAPFANIDDLEIGDKIVITTFQGIFTYAVTGSQIVTPDKTEVLNDVGDNRITLTACHPKYSLSHRIVVTGVLQGEPAPTPPPVPGRKIVSLDLSGGSAPKQPAILFGLLCAAIWLAAWLVGRKWRKWPCYMIGFPFFIVALFFFFENFSRLLPSNY